MIRKEQLYEQILEQIDLTKETDDEELQELIRTVLDEAAGEEYISLSDKIRIGRELFNSFRKLDVLQELLEDDSITEIMVNGIDHIFYEKEGRIFRSKKCFLSQERLLDVIQQIVGESNRYVNEASPIVDARLKDGSRVNVVLNPVAVNGPILTIRKFPSEAITMEELIRIGSVTDDAANFLKKLVEELRKHCGYDMESNTYDSGTFFYRGTSPFGEVVDYLDNSDGTLTLYVDAVWPDRNTDCAFKNEIVIKPYGDGTCQYLSNKVQKIELDIPVYEEY